MKFFPISSTSSSSSAAASADTIKSPRKHAASPPSSGSYYSMQQNAQRKRAKRQVAGSLVAGAFLGGGGGQQQQQQQQQQPKITPSGKKSTAQPRPAVTVPPRGIGPITDPNDNDVLAGRGGRINAHVGNVRFREMIAQRKKDYLSPATKKLEKAHIAAQIVQDIRSRNPSGRFLKEESDGAWWDIGDAKAIKKVGQALREDAPEIRHEVVDGEGEKAPSMTASSAPIKMGSAKASLVLPQQAVYPTSAGTTSSSQGGGSDSASRASSTYEPIPLQPNKMGPPAPGTGFSQQWSNTRHTISGAAAALMQEDDQPHYGHPQGAPRDVAFGRTFHEADANEASVISGLTNTMLSGMSGLSDDAKLSSLSGAERRRKQMQNSSRGQAPLNFHAMRAQQLQQLRQTWEATNSNRTLQGSDVVAGATMPAAAPSPPSQPQQFQRSHSWHDNLSVMDNMSWAEHSLAGGGISQDIASVNSAHSFYSAQLRNDSDSILEHLMQSSLAGSRRSQRSYAQNLYPPRAPATPPVAQQRQALHSGASVASMSIASGGVASIGSIRSIMSELSDNLNALDLAEPHLLMDEL